MKDSLQSGVTFSGGDPLSQCEAALDIAKKLKEKNINIWCYTGFEYETLIKNKSSKEFLEYIDVLVDGPYIEKLKSYDLKFKGSSNQRVINVQESLKQNKIVLWNEA
jgi:anaerobic ribonucleoside-triphosphate reductase activating protein